MDKPFKTADEQIEILKSRGINFTEENLDFAKNFLISRNYYSMINDYGKFFIKTSDVYHPGTTLKQINYVYLFDKRIKTILYTSTLEFEKTLKSALAYYYCEKHPGMNDYLHPVNYRHENAKQTEEALELIENIQSTIDDYSNKSYQNGIKHYGKTHGFIPLWVTIQFMYLGDVIRMFKCSNDKIQNNVCAVFSRFCQEKLNDKSVFINPGPLLKILVNIKDIRNCIAHNNRLLNTSASRSLPYVPKIHDRLGIERGSAKSDLYNILVIFQCLVSPQEYDIMVNSFKKRIRELSKNLTVIDYNIVTRALGFPKDWLDITKKGAS